VKIWATAALLLLVQSPALQQVRKGRIEGTVVRVGTNEPLPNVQVTIRRTWSGDHTALPPPEPERISLTPEAVTTDSKGHFKVDNLDPGSYELSAAKNGFARQVYGERAPGRPGAALTISSGQSLADVTFRLVPAGSVSGRVTDAAGEPIPGILVQLLRSTYDAQGQRTFASVSSARSNDRGEYRMYLITPGRFFVTASSTPSSPDSSMMSGNHVEAPGLAMTYYPGSSDPSGASSIEITPDVETGAIDFRLTAQPLFRIRGRVVDARAGGVPRNAQLEIVSRNSAAGRVALPAVSSSDGTFEIRNVAPGSYWIQAQLPIDPTSFQLSIADLLKNMAMAPVDVSNADVENVVVTFSSGFRLSGRIEIEGLGSATSQETPPLMVQLDPKESMARPMLPQTVKADGTFTLEGLLPGEYRVQTEGGPRNSYIKSAHLGRTDVLNGLTLSGPVSDSLEIVLSTASGEIQGTVMSSDRNPVGGVEVVLIPNRVRSRRDLYRTATTDQNGHFTIRAVVPGEYKLFAWEDLEPFAYNDPDFLRKYEERGTFLTVPESGKLTVETKLISVQR